MAEASKDDRFVQKLDFSSGNLAVSWKIFKSQFGIYKIYKKFADMGEEEKIANLLVLMGPHSVPIYSQFEFDADVPAQVKSLDNVIKMFDTHFEPVKNVIFERSKFNSMRQGANTIHQFITELQSQADNCDYGTVKNDLIRDRIVVGVNDKKLREYLIDVDDLDLPKCITKAKQYVTHHEHAAKMVQEDDNMDFVQKRKAKSTSKAGSSKCYYCNKEPHKREVCPARESECHICKEIGHWRKTRACKGKRKKVVTDEVTTEQPETDTSKELADLYLGQESE